MRRMIDRVRMPRTIALGGGMAVAGAFLIALLVVGWPIEIVDRADAAGGTVKSPTGTAPDRYVYYPGTEELERGEVRVIACGTGMPDQRRGQASACFLFA